MLKLARYFLILSTIIFSACKQEEKVKQVALQDFFKNPEKTAFSISPDGKYISYLKPFHNRLNIFVQTIDGKDVTQLTADTVRNIAYYFWADNNEILYLKNYDADEDPALYAVERNGKNTRNLISYKKTRISLISYERAINNEILIALNTRDSTVFDPYRLNIKNAKLTLLVKNPGNITNWYADSKGKLRMAVASDGVDETLLYRESEKEEFKKVLKNNFKTTIAPLGFSKNSSIFALSNQNTDRMTLVEFDCKTGREVRVIYSHPEVDVTDGVISKLKNKLEYAGYETWKKQRYYLDADIKEMYQLIEQQLPNTEIRITDRDSSENNFIVRTYTDRNPGTYYLYTKAANKLTKLSDVNSSLKKELLCEMKPISFKTRDGIIINGYLTLPNTKEVSNLPFVVIPHGGPSSRNSWGYNAEVQFLANRGYGVLQLNYRGSTGYGKAFWIAGFKQWGGKIQEDITDGTKWLIRSKIADPQRIAIYGGSFGGFSALHGLCFNSNLYACGASYSGLINLFTYLKGIPPFYKPYQKMYFEMVGNPEKDGDYFRNSSPIFHTDKIKVPVLIAQGSKDPRVNVNETNQFVKELKKKQIPVTYILKEEEGHFFNKQENKIEFYKELEAFLGRNLKKSN
ncbi:S9 family peptidase [Daejeonella oryzae]|uniref:S9 family peptidase n=1 Tax=Daejeonella oryzae TaxID=1122943 RepID=UPI0003F4C2CC|nr:S9 family peptidase [Daejeonella oryzae]